MNKIIGVSVMPFNQVYFKHKSEDKMLERFASAINVSMLNYPNMEVSLIVLNGGKNGDVLFTRELYKKLLFKEGVKI